jgi:hypothetical protein
MVRLLQTALTRPAFPAAAGVAAETGGARLPLPVTIALCWFPCFLDSMKPSRR